MSALLHTLPQPVFIYFNLLLRPFISDLAYSWPAAYVQQLSLSDPNIARGCVRWRPALHGLNDSIAPVKKEKDRRRRAGKMGDFISE
jgi:hypothetical protein